MTITEPMVTGNAVLLAGFVAARIGMNGDEGTDWYFVSKADPKNAVLTVEATGSGNVFQLSIVQIGGVE